MKNSPVPSGVYDLLKLVISHDNAWKSADQNDLMEIDHIIAGFNNSGELSDHLLDPHPGGGGYNGFFINSKVSGQLQNERSN